ncbi:MAG: hypothetical protein JKY96_08925 [Phycisphaerales bacterium]|nr:hypothetical protein [Phycisphaerales bacterium]
MKSTNRFLQIANRDSIDTTPLLRIFGDATPSESIEIIEAMYVIGERRAASGHPVGIQEITTAIGGLVSDKEILDAAIDVCMQGLLTTGYSESEAQSMLLDSTSSMMENGRAEDLPSLSTELMGSLERANPHGIELPCDFGPIGKDGQSR